MGTVSYDEVMYRTEPIHPMERALHGNNCNLLVRQIRRDPEAFIRMVEVGQTHPSLRLGKALYEGGEVGAQKLLYSLTRTAAIELMVPFGVKQINQHWVAEGVHIDPYGGAREPRVEVKTERFDLNELIGLRNMLEMQPEDAFILGLLQGKSAFYDAGTRSWLEFSVEGLEPYHSPLVNRITSRVKTTGDFGDSITDAVLRINGNPKESLIYDRKSMTITARDQETAESLDERLAELSDEFLLVTDFKRGSLVQPDENDYRGLRLMMARSDHFVRGEEDRPSTPHARYHLIEVKIQTPEARTLNRATKGREAHHNRKWERRMEIPEQWFPLRRAVEKAIAGAEYNPPEIS